MQRVASAVAVPITLATALVGCSNGSNEVSLDKPVIDLATFTPSRVIPGAYALPLDPIMNPDPTVEGLIDAAIDSEESKCMESKGFSFPGSPYSAPSITRRLFLTLTTEDAMVYGYAVTPEMSSPDEGISEQDLNSDSELSLAYVGDPSVQDEIVNRDGEGIGVGDPQGCMMLVRSKYNVGGARMSELQNIAMRIQWNTWERSRDSDATQAAFADWSSCMATEGYDLKTPEEAATIPFERTDEKPGEVEIKQAVADAKCQEQADVTRIWSGEEVKAETAALEENLGLVAEFLELQQRRLDRAQGN